ncbi:MAG: glycosyltransferase family 2 protein [bacterium]
MSNPKVSIIIPTYNRENLIQRAIKSITNQTRQDYEIIIADDASTDNTEEVIKSMQNSKIIYFKLEKNSGQCVSRNLAIKKARGEYIGFLDSDDEWLPEKIEKQIKVFENSEDPNLGAVYCGFIEKDEVLNKTVTINKGNRKGDLYKDLLSGWCPSTPTMFMVKRSVMKKVNGFDENLPTFVDYDLWLRIAQAGYTFDFVDEPLIVKYEHLGEQIAKNPSKRVEGLKIFIHKWGEQIKNVNGKKVFVRWKRNKIEALVRSILDNPIPGSEYGGKFSFSLLRQGKSNNLKLYIKSIMLSIFGKSSLSFTK